MQKPVETGKPILKHIPQSLKSASFSGSELFDGIDLNKAKIKFKKGKRNQDKKALCGKILNAFMDMVIEDVVENNVVFKTFSEKRPVLISVRLVEGDKFKRGCQFGKYPGLDFLKTNFTAPEVTFTF